MSSRFVSGGVISSGGEISKDEAGETAPQPPLANKTEWEAVEQELEAERRRREEARLKAATGEEKSLYEILQANKAAKQAAFEEQHRLKNQFRALDADEADFLDEVAERRRLEEERVRRETDEGLRAFRARQRGGDVDGDGEAPLDEEEWGVGGRKRKRGVRGRDVKGLRRKVGDAGDAKRVGEETRGCVAEDKHTAKGVEKTAAEPQERKASALVDYGSDDGDDD